MNKYTKLIIALTMCVMNGGCNSTNNESEYDSYIDNTAIIDNNDIDNEINYNYFENATLYRNYKKYMDTYVTVYGFYNHFENGIMDSDTTKTIRFDCTADEKEKIIDNVPIETNILAYGIVEEKDGEPYLKLERLDYIPVSEDNLWYGSTVITMNSDYELWYNEDINKEFELTATVINENSPAVFEFKILGILNSVITADTMALVGNTYDIDSYPDLQKGSTVRVLVNGVRNTDGESFGHGILNFEGSIVEYDSVDYETLVFEE